ncbi:MAG: tetratricopeptide repeat protein [Firmicutes bacterium]|nr:tetratricopeptide repeat protein [Bacillota bacterium]
MIQVIPFTADREPKFLPLLARGLSDLTALRLNAVEIPAQVNTEIEFGQWEQKPSQLEKFEWNNERELWFSGNLSGEGDLSLTLVLYDPQAQQVIYRDQFQVPEDKFLHEWEKSFSGLLQYFQKKETPSPRIYTKSLEAFLAFRKGLEILAQAKTGQAREEGMEYLLKAAAYDPEFNEAVDILLLFLIQNDLTYNSDFAIDILERLRQISGHYHPRIPLVLAEIYNRFGNYNRSFQLLNELTESFPEFIEGWVRLALLYNNRGHFEQALQTLQKALVYEPDNAAVLDLLGAVYAGVGERKQAEDTWLKALAIEPSRVNLLVNLALLAEEKENPQLAEEYYQRAVQVQEEWWGAFYYYGSFCQRQKRHEEAAYWFEKAAAINDGHYPTFQNLAVAQLELGKYDQAQESLLHLLKIAPDNTVRRLSLQLLNQMSDPRIKTELRIRKLARLWEAGKHWLVLLNLIKLYLNGRKLWFYWYLWSRVAQHLNLYRLRVAFWLIGSKLQPGFPLLKELGLYYWNKGNYQKSLPFLRQAFKFHRNDTEINRAYLQTLAKLGKLEELKSQVKGLSKLTAVGD